MNWKQRISAICHCASPIASMMNRPLCSWLLLALFATGQPLIVVQSSTELQSILVVYLLARVTAHAEELLASLSCGYRALRRRTEGMQWLHTHLFFALAKDMLPKSLGGFRIGFIPTALAESKVQERHPDRRPALFRRLRVMFLYQDLWLHVAVVSVAALVFTWGIVRAARVGNLEYLLTHLLVPGAEWSNHFASIRPITYAIWPPSMPERRDLMERHAAHHRADTKSDQDHLQLCTGITEEDSEISTFEVWRPKDAQKTEAWDALAILPEVPRNVGLVFWLVVGLGLYR